MEKKYSDFMKEIDQDQLFEGLLAYGMFADKLPPIFSGKSFFDFCKNINATITIKPVQYVYFEHMRNLNVPRSLGIPNPIAYMNLCNCMKENWDKIQRHFSDNTVNHEYKISRIHIRKMNVVKCLFQMNYKNFKFDGTPEPDLLFGKRFLVNADISNFFPSIYTHSIAWALVGKEEAKLNQKDNKLWYNQLDFYARILKHGETQGLLIGPHTSNVLSEIIMTTIDKSLYDKGWRFIRNIDDYSCYVHTYEEGQRFLIDLGKELRNFGLALNHKKTQIVKLPKGAIEEWHRKINVYNDIISGGIIDFKKIQVYLDLVVELMQKHENNSAILNYLMQIIAGKQLTNNARKYYIKLISHLVLIYPYLVSLLDECLFISFKMDVKDIEKLANQIYIDNIAKRNFEAAYYALFYAIKYNFQIQNIQFSEIITYQDPFLLLFAYLHNRKFTINVFDFVDHAEKLAKNEDDLNRNWIFVYEVLPARKLKDYWKKMKSNNVSFIEFDKL